MLSLKKSEPLSLMNHSILFKIHSKLFSKNAEMDINFLKIISIEWGNYIILCKCNLLCTKCRSVHITNHIYKLHTLKQIFLLQNTSSIFIPDKTSLCLCCCHSWKKRQILVHSTDYWNQKIIKRKNWPAICIIRLQAFKFYYCAVICLRWSSIPLYSDNSYLSIEKWILIIVFVFVFFVFLYKFFLNFQ